MRLEVERSRACGTADVRANGPKRLEAKPLHLSVSPFYGQKEHSTEWSRLAMTRNCPVGPDLRAGRQGATYLRPARRSGPTRIIIGHALAPIHFRLAR